MPKKICAVCKRVYKGKQCECRKEARKKQQKIYDIYTRDKINEAFYNSREWKEKRKKVVFIYDGIDIYEYYTSGKVVKADCTHHIHTLRERWEMRLEEKNLIPVSDKNHKFIHTVYKKGKEEREKLQKELECMLIRYREENNLVWK